MSHTGKKLRVSEYKALMKNRREEMRQLWCQDGSPVRTLLSVMRIYDDRENTEDVSAGKRKCLHAAVWQVRAILVDEQHEHGGRHVFLKLAHGTHWWAFLRQAIRIILTFLILIFKISSSSKSSFNLISVIIILRRQRSGPKHDRVPILTWSASASAASSIASPPCYASV